MAACVCLLPCETNGSCLEEEEVDGSILWNLSHYRVAAKKHTTAEMVLPLYFLNLCLGLSCTRRRGSAEHQRSSLKQLPPRTAR